jgi:hypothetical protein
MNKFKMSLALGIFIASIGSTAYGMTQELKDAIISGQQDHAIELISKMTAEDINRNNGEILSEAIVLWFRGFPKMVEVCLQHPGIDLTLRNAYYDYVDRKKLFLTPLEMAEKKLKENQSWLKKLLGRNIIYLNSWTSSLSILGQEESHCDNISLAKRLIEGYEKIVQLIISKQEEQKKLFKAALLAFAIGEHQRLGEKSAASLLQPKTLEIICRLAAGQEFYE